MTGKAEESKGTGGAGAEDDEDEDMDEAEIDFDRLEYIIDFLMESLKDGDTVVRWTAAKGIGRITGRLNLDFADQIVEKLFELFDDNETDNSWHGGMLALAELCRRWLLLPSRLEKTAPILDKALIYDINRGTHSVGANVRDAACYVAWSFARAYSPEIMQPYVKLLSSKLLVASLFDREVNCRRAASATFQECVGRQGNFPHGIEIITEADYFTLSNRINAYLNVSCFIAQFTEYFLPLIEHLTHIKLQHWEPSMRVLAAQSLSVLSVFEPETITQHSLKVLIKNCFDPALHVRHGAIFGVGEILIGLGGKSVINRMEVLEASFKALSHRERNILEDSEYRKDFQKRYAEIHGKNNLAVLGEETLKDVQGIIEKVEKQRLYRGKGGEIMRIGVCHLLYSMAIAQIPFNEKDLSLHFKALSENFKHPNILIQEEATKALRAMSTTYLNSENIKGHPVYKEINKMLKPSSDD